MTNKTAWTVVACFALALAGAAMGFAQSSNGSKDDKDAPTGSYSRKKLPGRMKSGTITATDPASGGSSGGNSKADKSSQKQSKTGSKQDYPASK